MPICRDLLEADAGNKDVSQSTLPSLSMSQMTICLSTSDESVVCTHEAEMFDLYDGEDFPEKKTQTRSCISPPQPVASFTLYDEAASACATTACGVSDSHSVAGLECGVAAVVGEEEEELEDLPSAAKQADRYFQRRILRMVGGMIFTGQGEDIEVGKASQERLYRIRYEDGDLEHLSAKEVAKGVRAWCA